jgi:hypothetical protein
VLDFESEGRGTGTARRLRQQQAPSDSRGDRECLLNSPANGTPPPFLTLRLTSPSIPPYCCSPQEGHARPRSTSGLSPLCSRALPPDSPGPSSFAAFGTSTPSAASAAAGACARSPSSGTSRRPSATCGQEGSSRPYRARRVLAALRPRQREHKAHCQPAESLGPTRPFVLAGSTPLIPYPAPSPAPDWLPPPDRHPRVPTRPPRA